MYFIEYSALMSFWKECLNTETVDLYDKAEQLSWEEFGGNLGLIYRWISAYLQSTLFEMSQIIANKLQDFLYARLKNGSIMSW